MRFASEPNASGQVFAVAGTHTVSFGIVAPEAARDGLLGYAVARRDAATDVWHPMDGFKVFPSIVPDPGPDLRVSSFDHPIQGFTWDDFTADADHVYHYAFRPAKGRPGALTFDDPWLVVVVHTEPLHAGNHDVFFNRGVASSQSYVRRFGTDPIGDLAPARRAAALDWLSRDLDDALLGFIDACAPGDRLRGCFYEFRWEPAARALTAALGRGVDVRLVVDGKQNGSTDRDGTVREAYPREDNLRMLALVGFPPDRVTVREARKSAIAHNKFMVRAPGGGAPAEVWTGSTNLSLGGIAGQTNVGHQVRDAAVAAAYERYWTVLSTDPGGRTGEPGVVTRNRAFKAEVLALSPVPADLTELPDGTTPAFSPRPDDTLLEGYARLLDDARRQACITLAFGIGATIKRTLMDNTVTGPLEFLLLEKKDVADPDHPEAFVRLNAKNNVYQAWGSFLRDPVYQWVRETNPIALGLNEHVAYIHSKFLLVDPLGDDPVVVSGSANFSEGSTVENDENMLLIRGDRRVADIYYTEFNRLFNHYYFRSVVEDRSRREPSHSPSSAAASRFLDETDGWVGKYAPGSFRAKRLALYASMAGAQTLPVPVAERVDHGVPTPRAAHFEVYRDAAGSYRWRLRSSNGQVMASGEAYATRGSALRAVDAVRRAAVGAAAEIGAG